MSVATSVYLDLVRFLAACVVFLAHASTERFGLGVVPDMGEAGANAVIVFFVLSGFVIAFVADHKDRTLPTYVVSRLARLYSVVLPALVVTIACDLLGKSVDPIAYATSWSQYDMPVVRFLASLTFVNELWFFSIRPFSNGPFWSIGYEFWYYVMFAAAYYFRGRTAVVLFALAAAVAGPKIVVLFPIWAMGAGVYYAQKSARVGAAFGAVLLGSSLLGFYLYFALDVREFWMHVELETFGREWRAHYLQYSRNVMGHYIMGVLVALNFLGFAILARHSNSVPRAVKRPIVFAASFTFSLYLLHYPLLQLFAVLIPNGVAVMCATLAVVFAVGSVTERRKEWARSVILAVWNRLGRGIAAKYR